MILFPREEPAIIENQCIMLKIKNPIEATNLKF